MVIYTDRALNREGNNMRNKINLCFAQINQALYNSQVQNNGGTFVLAHEQLLSELDEDVEPNIKFVLDNFRSNNTVLGLKQQHQADIVVFLANKSWGTTYGIANAETASPNNAFALVRINKATNLKVFSHEIGHLFGCAHGSGETHPAWAGVNAKAYGIQKCTPCRSFYTLVASNGRKNTRPLYFSNPNVNFKGVSFGAATNNNAEQMGLKWNIIANHIVSTQNNFTVSIIGYNCGGPLEADVKCGTAPFTFKWEYSINSGQSWTQFGTTEMVSTSGLCNLTTGVLIIRLTVTDAANRIRQAHKIYGIGGYRLADTGNISRLKMIPNPIVNNTVVHFSLLEEAEIAVTVKNNYGIEIINIPARRYSKGNNQVNLNFSKLNQGIYLVSLISKTEIKSSYIIKY